MSRASTLPRRPIDGTDDDGLGSTTHNEIEVFLGSRDRVLRGAMTVLRCKLKALHPKFSFRIHPKVSYDRNRPQPALTNRTAGSLLPSFVFPQKNQALTDMADNVTNELLLETLKDIQAKLNDMANDLSDVKADMRGLKDLVQMKTATH